MTKSLKSKLDYGPLRVTFDGRAKEGLLERVLIHNPTNRSSKILFNNKRQLLSCSTLLFALFLVEKMTNKVS